MQIYLICFFIIVLFMVISSQYEDKKLDSIFFFIVTLQLIILLGFRNYNRVGIDWGYYTKYYDIQLNYSYKEILLYTRYEFGFKILTKILSSIWNNKSFYCFTLSIISIVPIFKIIKNYSKNPFLSVILYIAFDFYAFIFSGIRQAIAISLLVYSYKYLIEKKKLQQFILVLLAILFHKSAIVFLPTLLIGRIKINKKVILFLIISSIAIYVYKIPIYLFLNSFFYDNYTITQTNSYNWMIMCLLISLVCLIFYKKTISNNKDASNLYLLSSVGAMITLFSPIAGSVLRIANYYYIFIILLIPEIINNVSKPQNKTIITTMVVLVSFGICFYLLKIDGYGIVPYSFFWS